MRKAKTPAKLDPYQVHNVCPSVVFLVGAAPPPDPATLHGWGIGWAEAEAAHDLIRWETKTP